MILHTLPLGQLETNCYLLADENTRLATLVDAADHADTILSFLEEQHYTLEKILLTHGHFDHLLAVAALQEATHAPLWIHREGERFLQDSAYNLCHHIGLPWTPLTADRLLEEGEILTLGGKDFKVLHTPGHTADSICLLGDGILLSGDTLFYRSIGRADFPTGDPRQEIASIQEKLMPLADHIIVYPGHGPSTTIGTERKGNPYLQ